MKTHTTLKSMMLLFVLLLSGFASEANAQSRRELKRMCRDQYKQCRKENSRKQCRKEKRQCRKDNGVTFLDDIKNIKNKLNVFAQKVASHVEFTLGNDENKGEYIEVKVMTKLNVDMGDLSYYPANYDSYISFAEGNGTRDILIRVYTSDLEERGIGEELQTSPGRSFPKFIDGVRYESLYGEPLKVAKKEGYQVYFDGEKKIFGVFIPSGVVGQGISKLNELKNKTKWTSWLPNINSVPVNLKLQKERVGRVSLLSNDEHGNNSGIVILFDHAQIKSILRD